MLQREAGDARGDKLDCGDEAGLLAAGTLCMQTLLTSSSVLLQTENVNIAQSELHEYDSMAGGPSAATAAAAARRTCCSAVPNCRALATERSFAS